MTEGFTFRLESVLRLRIDAQQKQQRTVADAQLALRALEDELSAIERDGQAARSELSQHLSTGNLDANWLRLNALHVQALQSQAAALIGKIHLARQSLASAQEQLAAATAQRKSLEKLRERQHDRFAATEQKRERNVQDEIAARQAIVPQR
jgi:flagellar export protein FliJ